MTTIGLETLCPWTAASFSGLATSSFSHLLKSLGPGGSVVGAGATVKGQPVGVALAELTDNEFVLCWIFVLPEHRRRGVGRALLGLLEAQICEQGGRGIHAAYSPSTSDAPWISRMFESAGWPPGASAFRMTCRGSLLGERWMHESRLPDGLAVFSRVGSAAELELRDKAWVPQKLAPWKYQKRLEPLTSVGLSWNEMTVGWLLTSRIATAAIGYESLFVHPSVRPLGGARFLLAEGIRRQAAAFGPASHGVFTVATENRSMIRLINRHLRQHLISETELIVLSKVLASDCGYG